MSQKYENLRILPAKRRFLSLERDIAVMACVGSPGITVGGPSDPPERERERESGRERERESERER